MQQDLRQKMLVDFPYCYPRGMAFAIGDGWLKLVYKASVKLEAEIKKYHMELPFEDRDFYESYITDVKEKYGGLRIYMSCQNEAMDKIIQEAEEEAYDTCELCGASGAITSGRGWITTRCNPCRNDEQ